MIQNIELQSAAAALIFRPLSAQKLISPTGHSHEPKVGPRQNPVKPSHLNIGLQHDFVFSRHCAIGGVGKGADPGPFLLDFPTLPYSLSQRFPGMLISLLLRQQSFPSPLHFLQGFLVFPGLR